MPKFSHLKYQTSHQPEPSHLDTFSHYVGPHGNDVKQTPVIRSEDAYAKQVGKKKR